MGEFLGGNPWPTLRKRRSQWATLELGLEADVGAYGDF